MIKKLLAILTAVLLAAGLLVSQAGASDLSGADCVFTFDLRGAGGGSLVPELNGFMGLTDTGNDIMVQFDGLPAGYNILAIYLNYDFSGPALTNLEYSTFAAGVAMDGVPADGYGDPGEAGMFDMQFTNSLNPLPTSGTLSLMAGAINIDPSLFAVPTSEGIYAGLLIDGGNLVPRKWVFASNVECAPVPEPSTLLLLGGGLFGLAGLTWRRRRNG